MAVSQNITLTQGTQSIENNTSQVTFTWTTTQTNDSWNGYTKTAYYYVSINGGAETKYSISYTLSKNTTQTLVSKTFTVTHNNDGTGSISVRTWMDTGISAGVVQKSKSLTLTTIPRSSKINSFTGTNLAGNFSVTYTPYSSAFTNKLRISIPNVKALETFDYNTSGKSFTLSQETLSYLYSYTSNASSVKLGAVIETWNGSTKIGESSELIHDCYVPDSIVPKLGTVTIDPVNIVTQDKDSRNILVKGKNKINISVSGSGPGTGSSIKSYTFTVLSGSTEIATATTTSTSVSLGPFSQTGTLACRVSVTDQRNRSASNTGSEPTTTCYDYITPYFSEFNAYRANSDGTYNSSGTYLKCTYTQNFSSVNGTNSATVKVNYNGTESSSTLINLGENSSTYKVYMTITDNYGGTNKSSTVTIFGQLRVLNITPNGTGIALGKMAERDLYFESRWPAIFDDRIIVGGVSTQYTPPSRGIHVHDLRYAEITPDSFGDQGVNFYFDQLESMNNRWMGIMHMKGWSGTTNAAWQLAGNAHSNLSDDTLRYRQGMGTTWGDWQTVLTNKNIAANSVTTLYENASGTTGTITISQSITDFAYLEFFLTKDTASGWWSVKVPSPNGKNVQVGTTYFANTGTDTSGVGLQVIGKALNVVSSGNTTTITPQTEYYMNFDKNNKATVYGAGTQTTVKVMKILGHKY